MEIEPRLLKVKGHRYLKAMRELNSVKKRFRGHAEILTRKRLDSIVSDKEVKANFLSLLFSFLNVE